MVDVAAIGEVLIDFIAKEEGPLEKIKDFEKHAGGAPANVMVGLSRLGVSSGLISRVGDDPFGKFLIGALDSEGVDTSQIQIDKEWHTGVVFVQLQQANPEFILYKNVAYNFISYSEIDLKYISKLKVLHFGSVLLREEPSRSTTFKAIQYARTHKVTISFDVNIRKDLWKGKEDKMWEDIQKSVELADIAKFSENEFIEFVSQITNSNNTNDMQKLINIVTSLGPKLIIITQGDKGCLIGQKGFSVHIEPYKVKPIDTTGAGDAFMAAIIAGILTNNRVSRLKNLSDEELKELGKFAVVVAALSTLKKGAWSVPTLRDLKKYGISLR